MATFLAKGNLRHEVRKIVVSSDMSCQYLAHRDSLAHSVVADGEVLLSQNRFRLLGVVYDRHIVAVDIRCSRQGHTHHAKLIADSAKCFNAILHGYKLGAKY